MAASVAVVFCCMSTGCSKTVVNEPESDIYTVSLGMGGEILEVTDEPLTRGNEETDLYGIQVYSTPNRNVAENETVTWTRYAYGLFATNKNININLLKGNRYKFVATMIVDGQNKVKNYNGGYSFPFFISGTNNGFSEIGTQFDYQAADYFSGLDSGNTSISTDGNSYSHAPVERFYGELVNYTPGKNNDKAMIKMKRVSFGAKFMAKGKLAKEGQLEIQITDAPKMLLDLTTSDKSISEIYTFKRVVNAYVDNNYSETIAVTLNWHKDDGTIFPLGTHEIEFKRNRTTVIQISIDNDQASGELGVEIDDVDMTEDDDIINIEDGEVVDTEIDTNK